MAETASTQADTSAVPRRLRARRWEAVPVLLLSSVVGYFVWSRLALRADALSQPVSSLLSIPPAWFWIPVATVGTPLSLVALACALLRLDDRPLRLFYVFAAITLFVQVFVLPDVRLPSVVTADFTAANAVRVVATRLGARAREGRLPVDEETLRRVLEGLPPPPYTRRGEAIARWRIVLHRPCTGPDEIATGLGVGTMVYCVRADRGLGWLTFVGTGGRDVGPPAVARDMGGEIIALPVKPAQ